MAAKVTVDLANKRVVAKAGVVALDAQVDLYSDLKEDWVANANGEMAFIFPFDTDGGRPIGGVLEMGAAFFLRNDLGWRIRPQEADHELVVTGNLYPADTGLPMFVPTLGGYTVPVMLERSSLTQGANILATPANLLATDASGRVTVGTNADKVGYALTDDEHGQIVADAASGVLADPANPLATDDNGRVAVGSNADKTGYALTAVERAAVAAALLDLADGVESGYTLRQTMRALAAVMAGCVRGAPTNPVVRDIGNTKDRVAAVVDSKGNRTAVALDLD